MKLQNTDKGPSEAYYLYNHVDLQITYHSGVNEDWGTSFKGQNGRIICKYNFLIFKNIVNKKITYLFFL